MFYVELTSSSDCTLNWKSKEYATVDFQENESVNYFIKRNFKKFFTEFFNALSIEDFD